MALSQGQWRAFERSVRALYVLADLDELPQRLLAATAPLIDSEIACYTELLPGGRVRNFAQHQDERLEALLPMLAEFQLQHPAIADFAATGRAEPMCNSDYVSRRAWHGTDLYQHFYAPLACEEQLAVMLPAAGGVHLGLVFNRCWGSFTAEERELLALLRPHLATAYANAREVSRLRGAALAAPPHDHHAVVQLDADGAVRFCSDRAAAALRRFGPRDARSLPAAVAGWVGREVRASRRGGTAPPQRTVVLHTRDGHLQLRLLQQPTGAGWLLLLAELPDRQTAAAALPKRLQRLLPHLLAGAGEKEIAARLQLSQHTVHEYVKQLYRHFAVQSRAALMARFVGRDPGAQP